MAEGPKREPDDLEDLTADEREEFQRRLGELERKAAEALDELESRPLGSVRGPMEMPEVLRERPARAPVEVREASRSAMARVWAIGVEFGAMVIAGGVLGWGADWLLKTGPWGVLVGLLLGLVVGFTRFVKQGLAENRRSVEAMRRGR